MVSRCISKMSGFDSPLRIMVSFTLVFFFPRIRFTASSIVIFSVLWSLIFKITSPAFSPALSPGVPSIGEMMVSAESFIEI